MSWSVLLPLLIQYGLPVAEDIFNKVTTSAPVTAADFDALRAAASVTAKDRMKAQLTAAGIALDSPQAVALLALT